MEWIVEAYRDMETSQKLLYAVGGVVVAGISALIIKKLLFRKEVKVYPRDTVILHQIGRGSYAPSFTPFAVKLETYLRMAKIPYQNVHDFKRSSKGKCPWIEYNGQAVADSTLCIDFLNKKLGIDLNKHLRPAEKGIAQSMQVMAEEHIYWCFAMFRYIYDPEVTLIKKAFKLNRLVIWMFRRDVRKVVYYQGLGRHSKEEVTLFLQRDLQGIADVLGQKKYLMGDTPCEADCAIFGQLSQLYWHCVGNDAEHIVRDQYPTLAAYCERIKTNYWPDWDECTTRGCTTVATK